MNYTHLSRTERYQIEVLFEGGWSDRAIAERIGRSASTVGRERRRNAKADGTCESGHAHRCRCVRFLATRQQREPQWSAQTILSQGPRSCRDHRSSASACRGPAQSAATKAFTLSNASGEVRGILQTRCTSRLNPPTESVSICGVNSAEVFPSSCFSQASMSV